MPADVLDPIYRTLGNGLADQAAKQGDKPALLFGTRQTSFAELDARASRIAGALEQLGCSQGKIAAILGRNSDRYSELIFGGARAGTLLLLMNWRLARPELEYVAGDTEPSALFFDGDFAGEARNLQRLFPNMALISLDHEVEGAMSYEAFLALGDTPADPFAVDPDEPCILLYTSGTTGQPKGVLITQYTLLQNLAQAAATEPPSIPSADDIALLSPPLFHVGGVAILLSGVLFGAQTVILSEAKVPDIVAAVEKHRITRACMIPALMPQIIQAIETGADLSSVKLVTYGMSPIPEPVLLRMFELLRCEFLQQYGMTEVSGSATNLGPPDHYPGSLTLSSCGRAFPDTELIVRRVDGSKAEIGEPGEVVLRSPSLLVGYWQGRKRRPPPMVDGWYETGDIGYLDADGYLFLCDRKKDMIVTGGENVYSAEVEAVVSQHPDVERVAVIGVPSEKWGEEVKAVIIPRPGADARETGIIAFARERLAGYKVPKSIDFVTELPVTSVGKLAKNVLRERYWQGRTRNIN
jgi:fatty-acyl-CoA synthase